MKHSHAFGLFLVLCPVLGFLAFTSTEQLQATLFAFGPGFQDIILDALHFPAVWLFYHALSLALRPTYSIIGTLVAIIGVEVIQLSIGREASLFDVFVGLGGLVAGCSSATRVLVTLCWCLYFGALLLFRDQVIRAFPNVGHFNTEGIRAHWSPLPNDGTLNSSILYIQSSRMSARVIKNNKAYWGIRTFLRRPTDKNGTPLKALTFCGRSQHPANVLIRMDDRKNPTYAQRINVKAPLTQKRSCSTFDLSQKVQALSTKGVSYDTGKILNLAFFLPPEAKGWFEIDSVEFTVSK